MDAGKLREMAPEERIAKLNDLKEEHFNLRFQHGIGQLENTAILSKIKRDIAKIKTIINENR
jgi:large subunit ribosomal protein L29